MTDNEKSIRSSNPGAKRSINLQPTPSSLQEEIKLFLKRRNILDLTIGKPINSLQGIEKNKICITSRPGNQYPGFLIIRNDSPVIYFNTSTQRCGIVRLAIDRRKLEKVGSIVLSATLYTNEQLMILDDVIWYNSKNMWAENLFSERWMALKTISQTILRPNPLFLGFDLTIAKIESVESWLKRESYENTYLWEFIPEITNTRRMLWNPFSENNIHQLNNTPILETQTIQEKYTIQEKHTIQEKPIQEKPIQEKDEIIVLVEKDKTTNLPDNYILLSTDNYKIGNAAVGKLTVSLALCSILSTNTSCKAIIKWNHIFKKYEIVEIVEDKELTPLSFFI